MNVFVISNGSPETFPDNTLTNFKNKLPTILEFPENENWCMAVESIGFSTNFRNIELPKNPEAPSLMLSNCVLPDLPKCPKMCTKLKSDYTYCIDEECVIPLNFQFQENEDNLNCFWGFYRFEDKFYTYNDMENFFLNIRQKHKEVTDIGIDPEYRFCISNIDNLNTGKDLWVIISDSMMTTFNIPKYFPIESTDYFQKTGNGQYQLVRKYYYSGRTEVLHNELPYITHYKGEKYYAFRIESAKKTGEEVNLVGHRNNRISKPKTTFPTLVKVVSNNVKQQIFNSTYSKDLLCFCPDFYKEDKYFFFEFENRQYVPLANSMITDLNVQLFDSENNYLSLLKGVPSIVKLDLKKTNMDEQFFNVRLTSVKSANFPDNTKSSFKVKLPNTLSLDRSWKVCLTSISHPNTFKTFLSDISTRKILIRSKGNVIDQFILEHKTYTKEELVKTLDILLKDSNLGYAKLDSSGLLVISFKKEDVEVLASNYLLKILGYNAKLNEERNYTLIKMNEHENAHTNNFVDSDGNSTGFITNWELSLPIDVNFLRPDYIIAYTNIVSSTIIGGLYSKILRVIPIKSSEMDYVVTEFHHKEYLELQNTEVSEIEIELRTHDGSLIDFGFQQDVILNLEFRLHNNE